MSTQSNLHIPRYLALRNIPVPLGFVSNGTAVQRALGRHGGMREA